MVLHVLTVLLYFAPLTYSPVTLCADFIFNKSSVFKKIYLHLKGRVYIKMERPREKDIASTGSFPKGRQWLEVN